LRKQDAAGLRCRTGGKLRRLGAHALRGTDSRSATEPTRLYAARMPRCRRAPWPSGRRRLLTPLAERFIEYTRKVANSDTGRTSTQRR